MTYKLLLFYMLSLVFTRMFIFLIGQRLQASDIVFLFLFILWLWHLVREKRLPLDTGLTKTFLVFISFCLLSFFNSTNLFLSTAELLGLIYLFCMLNLTVDIVDSKIKLDIAIKAWLALLTLVLGLGILGWVIGTIRGEENIFCWAYHGNLPYINKTICRTLSIFHNPLVLANYLIISLGFVVSELLLAENKIYRLFLKIIFFLMCLVMATTISREILGFLFCIFLIYSYFHKIKNLKFKFFRFLSAFIIITLFIAVTILCSVFHIRSYKIENFSKGTHKELIVNVEYAYSEKLAYKIAALEMAKRHPFLGVGLKMYWSSLEKLNNVNYFYFKNLVPIYQYIKGNQYFDYLIVNDPHNDILQYFAETGVFGGVTFIIFIITFLYLVWSNLKKGLDNRYFKVRLFCFYASFVGILIESIDMDVFKLRPVWFLMALTLALIRIQKDKAY